MPDHAAQRLAPHTVPGHPFPAGHGIQHPHSAICLCGTLIPSCPAMLDWGARHPSRGAAAGRTYTLRGQRVTVERGWRGPGPRNVLIQYPDGTRAVRPFRGLRRAP